MQKQENTFEQMVFLLEITSEDPQDRDIALVDGVRRDTIHALQNDGYRVQIPYTGERSGAAPIEVVTTLTNAATYVWAHKEVIEETMNDLSALVTIFGSVIPVIKHVFKADKQQTIKNQIPSQPIKIVTIIDGTPISVEAPDLEQAEAALIVAQRFRTQHPTVASKVTLKSKVKVKGNVSKRQAHRRR